MRAAALLLAAVAIGVAAETAAGASGATAAGDLIAGVARSRAPSDSAEVVPQALRSVDQRVRGGGCEDRCP
jgi:hypothetical protein